MDNFFYNIINKEENKNVFIIGIGIFIVFILSNYYNITFSLFIGLIFYAIIVSYFYTKHKNTQIDTQEKLDIQKKYIKDIQKENIVDFLFYLKSYEIFSKAIYLDIETLFKNFINLYDSCIINNDLINEYFSTMVDLKINILKKIKSFDLNGYHYFSNKINLEDMQNRAENILDNYLEELILINNKNIYYNGYNITTVKDLNQKVLPHNYMEYQNENVKGIQMFDINNL
jgi:hypothetical protein